MTPKARVAKLTRQIARKEKELQAEFFAYERIIREHTQELKQMKDDLMRLAPQKAKKKTKAQDVADKFATPQAEQVQKKV